MLGDERREISLFLKELMQDRRIDTVEELGQRSGLPPQRLRAYIRRECKPRRDLEQLARFAGISTDSLVERIKKIRSVDILAAYQNMDAVEQEKVRAALKPEDCNCD
jgi:DNA-binding Lrp family transcriptional regulator